MMSFCSLKNWNQFFVKCLIKIQKAQLLAVYTNILKMTASEVTEVYLQKLSDKLYKENTNIIKTTFNVRILDYDLR